MRLTAGNFASLKRLAYNLSGFNKYGLYIDDCLDELNPNVAEALRRLPQKLVDERNYRLIRALQCSLTKTYLPDNQWTSYDDENRYLKPYLEEVENEQCEREKWDKENN